MLNVQISLSAREFVYDGKLLRQALRTAGNEVANNARALIRAKIGGGRIYRGSGGSAAYRGYKAGSYQASAPGGPPTSVTGTLASSIKVIPFKSGTGVAIRDAMFYALFLEAGAQGGVGTGNTLRSKLSTRKKDGLARINRRGQRGMAGTRVLAPRPFLTLALDGNSRFIATALGAAFEAGITWPEGEMNFALVITQIKELCPFFSGNVAGAAVWMHGVEDEVWLPTPAAYVVPMNGEAGENVDQGGGYYQNLTERVCVFVQFDNSMDRRGQTVTNFYEPVKYDLLAAIMNWRPNSSIDNPGIVAPGGPGIDVSSRGMQLVEHGLERMDLARLFYRFTFELVSAISDADGWQPTSVPLVDVNANYPDAQGDSEGVPFDVPLPQT